MLDALVGTQGPSPNTWNRQGVDEAANTGCQPTAPPTAVVTWSARQGDGSQRVDVARLSGLGKGRVVRVDTELDL